MREGPLVLAVVAICLLSGLAPQMMGGDGSSETGSLYRQVLYLAVAGMVFVSLRPLDQPLRLLMIPLGLCIPLAWAAASVTWALNPDTSIRRLILTALIMWSICASVRFVAYERTIAAMRLVLLGFLIANYAVVFAMPEMGTHLVGDSLDKNLIGDWRGMMQQKNYAGPLCTITVVLFLFDAKRIPLVLRGGVILAAAYFLYRTDSRTSMNGLAAALAAASVYRFYDARFRVIMVPLVFVAILLALAYAYFYVDPWQVIYGNSALLTGRTQIWQVLWTYSVDHWMFGAGYGSFWGIGDGAPVYRYGKGWLWQIYEGHNGYLDLLATIGMPGLLLVILGCVVAPLSRLLVSRAANGPRGAMMVALIVFAVAHNLSESTLFDRDMNSWTYMVFAIALTYVITPDVGLRFARVRPATRLWRIDQLYRPNRPDVASGAESGG